MSSNVGLVVFSEADLSRSNAGKPSHNKCNPTEWKDRQKKTLKDAGKEYTRVRDTKKDRKGTVVAALVPPSGVRVCKCKKMGCNLDPAEIKGLYQYYRGIDASHQRQFLASCIEFEKPKAQTVSLNEASKRKEHTIRYSFKVKGVRHVTCRKRFLSTLMIKNSSLRTIVAKMKDGENCFEDGRGRAKGVHPNMITEEVKMRIRAHIDSFPKYESHYTRRDSTNSRKYLESGLSIAKMHRMFNSLVRTDGLKCSYDAYRNIFMDDFKLSLGYPKKDTCDVCDLAHAKISRETNASRREKLIAEVAEHQQIAKSARVANLEDRHDPENGIHCITTDVEKVLFVPQLSCGSCYFKRTLSTFNLGIHQTGTEKASMYLWDETIAKHCSQDIISCIWKYVLSTCSVLQLTEKRSLIIWTDRCIGQFNNIYMIMFMKFLVDKNFFTQVEHKFFCTGHSYMQCDRDFGLVEKNFRLLQPVVPADIDEVVRTARVSNPFNVQRMSASDFAQFSILANLMKLPVKCQVTKYLWFKYTSEHPNTLFAKSHHQSTEWSTFIMKPPKTTKCTSFADIVVPPTYTGALKIKPEKAKDLKELMQKIPDKAKFDFYEALTNSSLN